MKKAQEMIDAIRKGDRLGHKAMQDIADKLELFERDNINVRKISEQRGQDIIRLTDALESSQDLLSILRLKVESMDSDRTFEDFGKDVERLLSSVEVYEHLHWDNVRTLEAVTGRPYVPGYFKETAVRNDADAAALENLTMICQTISERLGRTVTFRVSSAVTPVEQTKTDHGG